MKRPPGPDVQRGIEFLSNPDLADGRKAPLPDRPDYQALARRASEHGHDLSPDALQEAFRLMMRARLLVLGKRQASATGGPATERSRPKSPSVPSLRN